MPDETISEIKIYVYASCHFSEQLTSNIRGGSGGYGVVITVDGQPLAELAEGYTKTNNARMDIRGITEGLKRVMKPGNIIVYSSNGYVIDTLTKDLLS